MKKYAVIDQTTGDSFEDLFDTESEAVAYAEMELNHLTEKEKANRLYFAVMLGEVNEDDCFDLDAADEIRRYI